MNIEIYTDGSATTAKKPGGYGWVIVIDGQKYSEGSGHMERATNNDAELEAAIMGLRSAYKYLREPLDFFGKYDPVEIIPPSVTLVSDSQLILGWATGKYVFRQQDKLDRYQTLRLLMANLNATIRWVEGHTGDEHNERCDQLANEARLGTVTLPDPLVVTQAKHTLIGSKKTGVACIWYKNCLKIINFQDNIIEDYHEAIHGPRGSTLEIREEKSR
jgi:ribonuclease HI